MKTETSDTKPVCGIIMPISALDGCSEAHWSDVLEILTESIEEAGFEANVVSNAEDVGIIQKRIIQNLYENPIVVCDVSGKNPNVMFELGLRLAFNKPTIIVKDDKTSYSFDTAPIEHLDYPRDLRFTKIIEFKKKLIEKIKGTYEVSLKDPSYTTFLKHFGEFTVAKLDKKEISGQEYILEELRALNTAVRRLERTPNVRSPRAIQPVFSEDRVRLSNRGNFQYCLRGLSEAEILEVTRRFGTEATLKNLVLTSHGDHQHLEATLATGTSPRQFRLKMFGSLTRSSDKEAATSSQVIEDV